MRSFAFIILLFVGACNCEDDPGICIDPSKIDPTAACIEIYSPVCGCDGNTYDNSCFAEIAGVTSWKEGSCGD